LDWPEVVILIFFAASLPVALLIDSGNALNALVGLLVGVALGLFFAGLWRLTRPMRRREDEKARNAYFADTSAFVRNALGQTFLVGAVVFITMIIIGISYADMQKYLILGAIIVVGGIVVALLGLLGWTRRIPHE
jgi:hypothetical protein